jgi:sec-independent protein translocase protein TatA
MRCYHRFMPSFSWEWLIVVAVLLMLFGAKRLPEMGRSLGRGMREFKEAVTGNDDEPAAKPEPPAEVPARTTAPTPTETQSETESERVSNSS